MINAEVHALDKYINALNDKNAHDKFNPYDLAWQWCGSDTTPYVEVFEETDGHILCSGTIYSIINEIRDALPEWDLEDVDSAEDTK